MNTAEMGEVSHVSEDQLVVKVSLIEKVPMFFRPVFLKKNESMIGKVEEIFGPVNEHVEDIVSEVKLLSQAAFYFSVP